MHDTPAADRSAALAFAGSRIDRRSEARPDTLLAEALADPAARLILFAGGRLVHAADGGSGDAAAADASLASGALPFDRARAVLLGHDAAGAPVLAAPAAFGPDDVPEGWTTTDLRGLIARGPLSGPALGDVAHAAAMLNWHQANGFCGRCGGATRLAAAGAKRICTACAAEHFPRTDPVAIMLVTHDGACLLGRGRHFPPGMVSCLAGFVEPGETVEDAVRRETFEESGIRVGRVTYVASQPWPMPHSLMLGFACEALGTEIVADADELELCAWFSRADVAAMLAGTHPDGFTAPLKGAIARELMALFAEGGL